MLIEWTQKKKIILVYLPKVQAINIFEHFFIFAN